MKPSIQKFTVEFSDVWTRKVGSPPLTNDTAIHNLAWYCDNGYSAAHTVDFLRGEAGYPHGCAKSYSQPQKEGE